MRLETGNRKKVLIVTDVNFWERSSGNRQRIYSLVKYLAQKVALTVVNTGPAPGGIEETLSKRFTAEFYVLEKNNYLNSDAYGRKLRSFLKERHFDSIIIEYIHSSYFLGFLRNDVQVILDAHDIISQRSAEFKKFDHTGAFYELTEDEEKEILGVYDHIVMLCPGDAEKVNTLTGEKKAIVCPHAVEPVIMPVNETVANIVFVASAYLPNRDAINWFVENCWPALSARFNVKLRIYGTVCEDLDIGDDAGISATGFSPDMRAIYQQADIVINPVRFGAGLKIKNVEAMAHGRPLVTTTHGSRGLEAGAGKAFLTADTAEDFVAAVSELITSHRRRKELSREGYSFIGNNYSDDICFEPLLNAINRYHE